MTGTLEEHGIEVFQSRALHVGKFDGLACKVNEAPIIVVDSSRPGDRQRFTLAHELGHLILEGRLPATALLALFLCLHLKSLRRWVIGVLGWSQGSYVY